MEPYAEVQESYREFAGEAGDSPTFAAWSAAVAEDEELTAWIATLPGIKQQPNLVFAAARWHGVPAPGPYQGLREALLGDDGTIRATILARATQTNEVGRLATLLPVLSLVADRHQAPLSLIEVGPSAGLCLYPDRWGYRWEREGGVHALGPEPSLPCRVTGSPPLPSALPPVAARRGLDLAPVDVTDPEQTAWLEQLVWPEQHERRARLRHAVEVARREPPDLRTGDLLEGLPALVAEAAADGPVVVFHTAVIAYLAPQDRERYDAMVRELVAAGACHWISNESKLVLPSITRTGPPIPEGHPTFVLGLDGQMVAQTHGHGRSMHWTAD